MNAKSVTHTDSYVAISFQALLIMLQNCQIEMYDGFFKSMATFHYGKSHSFDKFSDIKYVNYC